MTSRWISAILWTLVSVNVITLVLGGLITWLGYAIPVRLRQFGLLPELVVTAGFASLIVACIGLCALNYSSHYALYIYGFSCLIFTLMLVLGIPEAWYKSEQFADGSFFINFVYFALLLILILMLIFAFMFAHYLRNKEMLQNLTDQLGIEHNSPNCTCAIAATDNVIVSSAFNNNRASIVNKWFPSMTTASGNNNLGEMNFGLRNNHKSASSLLSDCRVPIYANNSSNIITNSTYCTGASNQISSNVSSIFNERNMLNQHPAALIHKGFYQNNDISFNRPMNEQDLVSRGLKTYATQSTIQPERGWGSSKTINRLNNSNKYQDAATRDDSSVQYGNQKHRLLQMDRCRCNLGSAGRINMSQMLRNSEDRNYINSDFSTAYTMPRLSSTSTYAIRSRPKIRTKASSSVVAMTAVAAATLFGGVTDTSSLAKPNYGIDDLPFIGADTDESLLMADNNRRDFDNNDHQLDVATLDAPINNAFHHNVCQHSTLDFAPISNFRK